ncbi:hypothetical protein AX14_009012 [Amanita brunnescens Koide BX004]|nr:hypothetical protein AX14_009012 [Amanita brunnescens Koide BX004]
MLDTARWAAMADDLAHVLSIKRIADIFMEMLDQLQGMDKSRDYFHEVTNEIGNLIELVVQYARERDLTSQRFVEACNNFLSTVSSLKSEMEYLVPLEALKNALQRQKHAKLFY